jgi:hypothetical protein
MKQRLWLLTMSSIVAALGAVSPPLPAFALTECPDDPCSIVLYCHPACNRCEGVGAKKCVYNHDE